jgi:hypothetical protein
MASLTSMNVEPPPAVNLVLQGLYCPIRRLFADFRWLFADYSYYSSTIRTIRRLFADYSHYSLTIRGLFALFVDYSHYSPTIRTIRFTILVLSIALLSVIYIDNIVIKFRYIYIQCMSNWKEREWREDLRKSKTCIKRPSHCYSEQFLFCCL